MAKLTFGCTFTATVELDDSVIERGLSAEYQEAIGKMDRGDLVEHLAWNLVQGRALSELDGFADMSDELAEANDLHCEDATELA